PSRIAEVAALLLAEVIREIAVHAAGAPPDLVAAAALRAAVATSAAIGRPDDASVERWVRGVARDLRLNPGRSIVIAGERQTAEVHAIVHALNALLGNAGRTVRCVEPPLADAVDAAGSPVPLPALTEQMRAGAVDTL